MNIIKYIIRKILRIVLFILFGVVMIPITLLVYLFEKDATLHETINDIYGIDGIIDDTLVHLK